MTYLLSGVDYKSVDLGSDDFYEGIKELKSNGYIHGGDYYLVEAFDQ